MQDATGLPELPHFFELLGAAYKDNALLSFLGQWHNLFASLFVVVFLSAFAFAATRKQSLIPEGLQNVAELLVEGIDDFVRGILGDEGKKYLPFIGTLFLYILCMNLLGFIPFMESATTSWSTTLALALCVFCYVQYTAFKKMGVLGYCDHLAGKPRGIFAFSIVLPLFFFALHLISELLRPISLSLRLRSNIWGDDLLLAMLSGFGLKGLPILFWNTLTALLTAVIQALVFGLLSTIYFALILNEE